MINKENIIILKVEPDCSKRLFVKSDGNSFPLAYKKLLDCKFNILFCILVELII